MDNWLLALSNAPCLWGMVVAGGVLDHSTALIVLIAGMFSFVFHLGESGRHGLAGCLALEHSEVMYWHSLDLLGVSMVIGRMIYLIGYDQLLPFLSAHIGLTGSLGLALILNLVSERFPPIAQYPRRYAIVHSLWHVSIFSLLGLTLTAIYN